MYCCGIDPGLRNFAICIVKDEPFEIVYLERVNLFDVDGHVVRLDPKLTTHFCNKYFQLHEDVFRNVGVTVVENQMQRSMLAVQYSIETLFQRYGSAISIHPSTVKAYFGTRKNEYAANKRAAIERCQSLLSGVNLKRFNDYIADQPKADDVADALLLAIYAARQHKIGLFSPPKPKPKKRRLTSARSKAAKQPKAAKKPTAAQKPKAAKKPTAAKKPPFEAPPAKPI